MCPPKKSEGRAAADALPVTDIMRVLVLAGKHIRRVGELDHAVEFLEMVKAQRINSKVLIYPHRHSDKILAVSSRSAQDERVYPLPVGSSP